MTPRDKFLNLVDHKTTGRDHGMFRVPTRADKTMSGTWRELGDGRLLVHDFGGDSVDSILGAIGLEIGDLFPERAEHQVKPERRAFPALDVLRAIAFEACVVLTAAAAVREGKPLTRVDDERLALACGRLQSAVDAAGGARHG